MLASFDVAKLLIADRKVEIVLMDLRSSERDNGEWRMTNEMNAKA
jgi:hypothetical protein